jgi:hypothetical protein
MTTINSPTQGLALAENPANIRNNPLRPRWTARRPLWGRPSLGPRTSIQIEAGTFSRGAFDVYCGGVLLAKLPEKLLFLGDGGLDALDQDHHAAGGLVDRTSSGRLSARAPEPFGRVRARAYWRTGSGSLRLCSRKLMASPKPGW